MASGKCSLEVSRLIAEVNSRPELWDRQHPQHHNRSVLDHHWESVAALLGITGKAARGKWKNLKDHFRKEYKRCMTGSSNGDQEMSQWPYFYPMLFIREQILPGAKTHSAQYLSEFRYQAVGAGAETAAPDDGRWEHDDESVVYGRDYPGRRDDDNGGGDRDDLDDQDGYQPLNCLHVSYGNQSAADAQDENVSDDKHFLLSLLPMFATLAPDKKFKARIAIETALLNIAYPELGVAGSAGCCGGCGGCGGGGGAATCRGGSPRRRAARNGASKKSAAGAPPSDAKIGAAENVAAPDTTTATVVAAATAVCEPPAVKKRKSAAGHLQQKKRCTTNPRTYC